MKKHFALAVLLAAAPFAASAGELSYTFVEAGYARTDIDDLGDGDGFGVNGSLALNDMFHVFGGYSQQQQEESGVEVDLDQFRIGLGYNHAASDRTDILLRVAYERAESDVGIVDVGTINGEADGYSLEVGARSMLTENLEVSVMGGYTDVINAGRLGSRVLSASSLSSDDVYNLKGEKLGSIKELMLDIDTGKVR